MCNVRKQFFFVLFGSDLGGVCVCVCVCVRACVRAGGGSGGALLSLIGMFTNLSNASIKVSSWLLKGNDVVLSSRWQFQDGRSKGMGTEWDKEVVGKVDPQKRVLCLAQGFLRG